jgi:hypothetical protein
LIIQYESYLHFKLFFGKLYPLFHNRISELVETIPNTYQISLKVFINEEYVNSISHYHINKIDL